MESCLKDSAGYEKGYATGYEEGRAAGFKDGRSAGYEEGRTIFLEEAHNELEVIKYRLGRLTEMINPND